MQKIIYEYSEIEDKNLKQYIINAPKLHKYFKLNWNILKSQQYCGIFNFGDEDFYLLPKIIKKNEEENLAIFVYMLMYAYDIKLENENIASCKNEKYNILEVFIQLFAQGLLKKFQAGIYKEYRTEKENLTTLRGKYLINENLKYNFVKNKIYCEYDEFSMDNSLNQFFLYAIKSLLPFTKNKKLLKQCELVLDEVQVKQFDINKLNISFNRLNNRFQESFDFALLLLKQSIPLFEQDKKSFAFLFDMNILFERFVGKMIQESEPSTQLQSCDVYEDLTLKPDIIMNDLIIDTKYKMLNTEKDIKRDDKFQMYVYGNNYKIKKTMLLYPKHLKFFDNDLFLGVNENGINMKIKSLDLGFDGRGYGEYINRMKMRVKGIVQ